MGQRNTLKGARGRFVARHGHGLKLDLEPLGPPPSDITITTSDGRVYVVKAGDLRRQRVPA